ncbi:hypothetical protein F4818DRAFT_413106 [Hypoxylon cercidicola]|nr:hypothetical protein F4818DRAFT_413106 [Hypoxylon cercidicola]
MEPYPRPDQLQRHDVEEMNSISREIQDLYDANTPLFTKDSIRKVGDKLDVFQKGTLDSGEITLKGINGVDYKVFIDPPYHNSSPNQHLGCSTWIIDYRSIQRFTTYRDRRSFYPREAYLPMVILACTREIEHNPKYEEKRPVFSTEGLSRVYQDAKRQWRTGEYQERLQMALATIEVPFVLNKVVALALGPLKLGSGICDASIDQHVLVSVIHSSLLQHGILSVTSERYVQDPAYTQMDRDVLSSEGFTVLNDPQAFLVLDESSILVSINPDIPVKQIVADICRPGIIIWDKHDSQWW